MKTIRTYLLALAALFASSGIGVSQEETPIIPVGTLSAFPTIVQTGTHPQLTWEITLPEIVEDIVDIEGPGTVVPKRRLIMDVRILGAGVTSYNSYYGTLTFVPTECQLNFNGGGYSRIFYGTNHDVNPNEIVYSREVEAGDTIDLGARYYWNSSWGTWYSSTNHNYNVVALRNGDLPPTTTPMHQAPTIESFIRPYLGNDGRLNLGSRDVLYLMELTHTDRNHGGWDLQDMAVLLTFYDEVSNNGHGNNVDGVDSSNPGNAPFTDSDPNVDDESGTGGGGGSSSSANNDDDDDDDDDDGRRRGRRRR